MGINLDWSVLRGLPNIGEEFRNGMAQGRETFRQGAQDNALAGLARNPDDPEAQRQLMGINPDAMNKITDRRTALTKAKNDETKLALEENRDNIMKGAQIVRQMNPTDQASWDQVLVVAKRAGIPITQDWAEYNPDLVKGLIAQANTFEPLKSDTASPYKFLVNEQGVYVGDERTGGVTTGVIPNADPARVGKPATAPANGIPTVRNDDDFDALPPGAEFKDPQGNVRKKPGGRASTSPGNFR